MLTIIAAPGEKAPTAAMSEVGEVAAAIFDALPEDMKQEIGEVGCDCSMTTAGTGGTLQTRPNPNNA
jgi:NTP pyrophosphatase (non-canonical NTP hydrolase)